jgi:hypothetical protein
MANYSLTFQKTSSKNPIINSGQKVTAISHQIILKDGFQAKYGSDFTASINDCIETTSADNPVGPLEHNIISATFGRSATSETKKENFQDFITDYSSFSNIHPTSIDPKEASLSNNNNLDYLHITPNPTSGSVTIFLKDLCIDSRITLTNLQGEGLSTIRKEIDNTVQIDLSNYAPGIYFIKVSCRNKIITRKIIRN